MAEAWCRLCRKTNFKRRGRCHRSDGSLRPRLRCLGADCGKRFTHNPGFIGEHREPAAVGGAPAGHMRKGLAQAQPCRFSSYPAPLRARRRCAGGLCDAATCWSGTLAARRCRQDTRHAGETRCRARNGNRWMSAAMGRTGFMPGREVPPTRLGFDAASLSEACTGRTGGLPCTPITAGLAGFAKWCDAQAQTSRGAACQVRFHARQARRQAHPYERPNGDIRMAVRQSRGFNPAGPAMFAFRIIHHSFIKRRGGLGVAAPAEAAGITARAGGGRLAPIQSAALASRLREQQRAGAPGGPPSAWSCGRYPAIPAVPVRPRNVPAGIAAAGASWAPIRPMIGGKPPPELGTGTRERNTLNRS